VGGARIERVIIVIFIQKCFGGFLRASAASSKRWWFPESFSSFAKPSLLSANHRCIRQTIAAFRQTIVAFAKPSLLSPTHRLHT